MNPNSTPLTWLTSWRVWLHSLAACFIGGGASAVTAAGGLYAAKGFGIDVPLLNFKAAGVVFLSAGAWNALAYLKQSPLPSLTDAGPEMVTLDYQRAIDKGPIGDGSTETKKP